MSAWLQPNVASHVDNRWHTRTEFWASLEVPINNQSTIVQTVIYSYHFYGPTTCVADTLEQDTLCTHSILLNKIVLFSLAASVATLWLKLHPKSIASQYLRFRSKGVSVLPSPKGLHILQPFLQLVEAVSDSGIDGINSYFPEYWRELSG